MASGSLALHNTNSAATKHQLWGRCTKFLIDIRILWRTVLFVGNVVPSERLCVNVCSKYLITFTQQESGICKGYLQGNSHAQNSSSVSFRIEPLSPLTFKITFLSEFM
jgi:hypothetical protein